MHVYRYKLPLQNCPLPIRIREGALLRTETGWGDLAPLPSFSRETLDQSLASLSELHPLPSAHFALECARIPFPSFFPRIPISALAMDESQAFQAIQTGFSTIKLKVGHLDPEQALGLISKLQRPSLMLRIDVNRRWSLDQAARFFYAVDPQGIEYIEEPTRDPRDLAALPPLPIALDETLLESPPQELLDLPQIAALILKPTLLGSELASWIAFGRARQKKLVLSSSFESPVGLVHLARLQASIAPHIAAGLDTHRYFSNPFFPLPIRNGILQECAIPPLLPSQKEFPKSTKL